MVQEVVWEVGQKRSRVEETKEAFSALVFHYKRCLFGASYGMKGAGA